jgi:DNA ligase D-like protein (predicted polymerase)
VAQAIELEVGPRTVRVTNPDRIYFPRLGITKADVVEYFVAVAEPILAALRERPTMLERWPKGVLPDSKLTVWKGEPGDAFYQRRVPKGAPDWVQTARVAAPDGSYDDVVCPTEAAVVAWAANLGTLRFHPATVRRADLEHPDTLPIDLDPQPGTDFREVVRVALELRALLGEVGVIGFPKTTGGRGLHVLVPIEPRWTYAEVQCAAFALGRELVRRMPEQTTIARLKKDRGERVYVDSGQMTVTSAYSIRPTPHARVSAPLTWEELPEVTPADFDVTTMPARYAAAGDPHAGLDDRRFSIEPLLEMDRCSSR